MNSRRKGADGERELAKVLRGYGFDSRRGQQFKGGTDSPDVTGIPGYHIECKRVEQLNIEKAIQQSTRDAGKDTPLVMHRKNNEKWKVTLWLDDFIKILPRSEMPSDGMEMRDP